MARGSPGPARSPAERPADLPINTTGTSFNPTSAADRPSAPRDRCLPLFRHLNAVPGDVWHTTFTKLETILGFALPESARTHPAWWSNSKPHSHASAWLAAGWMTRDLGVAEERAEPWPRSAVVRLRPDHQCCGDVGERSGAAPNDRARTAAVPTGPARPAFGSNRLSIPARLRPTPRRPLRYVCIRVGQR